MGRQSWWEASTGFWSCMVVNCNSFNSYCCKTWATISACYACLYGNWRGWSFLLLYYICHVVPVIEVIFALITRQQIFLILCFQGVAMPAMNNILSKWIPVSERSRSLALVYSGMYLGSVTGLGFSPFLIQKFGWPSVFYSFGSLGSIWFALWLRNVSQLSQFQ